MAANKVIINGETKIDLTADTVTAATLQKGVTAHDKSGAKVTGTLSVPSQETKTVELSMQSGNQTISPSSGKVLSKVTVTKPSTLIPENIKEGVDIGGVTGTLQTGGGSTANEVWVFNSNDGGTTLTIPSVSSFAANFRSNGEEFVGIEIG